MSDCCLMPSMSYRGQGEAADTNFIVVGLRRSWLEHTIYRTSMRWERLPLHHRFSYIFKNYENSQLQSGYYVYRKLKSLIEHFCHWLQKHFSHYLSLYLLRSTRNVCFKSFMWFLLMIFPQFSSFDLLG